MKNKTRIPTVLLSLILICMYVLSGCGYSSTTSSDLNTNHNYPSYSGSSSSTYSPSSSSSSSSYSSSGSSSSSSYGTTCAHSGCANKAVTSGDSVYCAKHSRKCLECGSYIDEDAMYCMSCIKKAIKKNQ